MTAISLVIPPIRNAKKVTSSNKLTPRILSIPSKISRNSTVPSGKPTKISFRKRSKTTKKWPNSKRKMQP